MNPAHGGAGSAPPPPLNAMPDKNDPSQPTTGQKADPLSSQAADPIGPTMAETDRKDSQHVSSKDTNDKATNTAKGSTKDKGKEHVQNASSSQTRVSSATCIPKSTERTKIDLPSHRINDRIQYMRDHALIGKFLGLWPTEKALQGWIVSKWKPKGQVTLQLGPKGFFTAIFHCLEDKTRIFDGGPYFFNSAGLYLRD